MGFHTRLRAPGPVQSTGPSGSSQKVQIQRADVFRAWGRILCGYFPALSIEITNRCPLSCPGCYAFQPEHLGALGPLESLAETTGDRLVRGILDLVERNRPLVVYLVGGEPLVRYRELNEVLPVLNVSGVTTEVVTSAVRAIPEAWAALENVNIVVSIDGLQPEHDARRSPATYERIMKHIEGHRIAVACTVTSQMMRREGYLSDFVAFWSARPEVRAIRISFFTPQIGETSEEVLSHDLRRRAVDEMDHLRLLYPKLQLTAGMLKAYLEPPANPSECTFARITRPITADLESVVTPCVFGGTPDCANCGCIASMALHAVAEHRLPGGLRAGTILTASEHVGTRVRRLRERATRATVSTAR